MRFWIACAEKTRLSPHRWPHQIELFNLLFLFLLFKKIYRTKRMAVSDSVSDSVSDCCFAKKSFLTFGVRIFLSRNFHWRVYFSSETIWNKPKWSLWEVAFNQFSFIGNQIILCEVTDGRMLKSFKLKRVRTINRRRPPASVQSLNFSATQIRRWVANEWNKIN